MTVFDPTRLDAVLDQRTRYLTTVTEDLYQPRNGAAVLRACESFGVQDHYAIQNYNSFRVDPDFAAGAQDFVDVHVFDGQPQESATVSCLKHLKGRGYRIFATSLREGCIPLDEVPLDQPLALCFGTELAGLSEEAHQHADVFVRLPMYGFTQSFNISVTMAMSLYQLTTRLRALDVKWQLDDDEKVALRRKWSKGASA